MLVGISQHRLTAREFPLAPRRNHFDVRHQRIRAQFKTHLVVAFARCAVANRIALGFFGDLYQTLGNQRTRNGRAQQVFTLVQRIGAEHWEDEITHKLFAQVFDVNVLRLNAHLDCFGTRRLNFFALANIRSKCHHFALVLVL